MTRQQKFLTFSIADYKYAIALMPVLKFAEFDRLTTVPQASDKIAGLLYNNGQLATVINSYNLLNLKKKNHKNNICLLFEFADKYYALLVDEGGENVKSDKIFTDRQKKNFKNYIKGADKEKIYILEVKEILQQAAIYD